MYLTAISKLIARCFIKYELSTKNHKQTLVCMGGLENFFGLSQKKIDKTTKKGQNEKNKSHFRWIKEGNLIFSEKVANFRSVDAATWPLPKFIYSKKYRIQWQNGFFGGEARKNQKKMSTSK